MRLAIPPHTPLLAALLLALPTSSADGQERRLTLEQTSGRGESVDLSGSLPSWGWAPDGEHLVRGRGEERVWVHPRTFEERAPDEPAETAQPRSDRERRDELRQALERVDPTGGEIELEELSPDGERVAFVRGNDLFVLEVATGQLRALTSGGDEQTFNGKLDWVYQEEVYGRGNFKAFWWSPDSRHIAYLRLDESAVHEFPVVDHVEKGHHRALLELTNYPKAGDPNPSVMLGVADVETGGTVWVDLAPYADPELLIVRVNWTPAGDRLLFMVQDRIQQWLDLNAADPVTGEWTTWIHEQSESWTERLSPPRWLADGTFLWLSHRTGYQHIYHYQRGGELIRAVTGGEWRVRRLSHVDEEQGLLWFGGTADGAVNRNTYRVAFDGSGLTRLTKGPGQHSLTWNPDRSLFLDRVSSLSSPSEMRLCSAEGEVLRLLGQSEIAAREEYLLSDWQLMAIQARDGYPLDAAILRPVPFDETRPHPVWLTTYSGPDAPSVSNRWSASTWDQFLAQQGIVVLKVNVRSASGRGHAHTSACYRQAGVSELRDLEDAVAWLTAHPWADAERVGITGHSYGGFMTAFALTHSRAFALGVAGSGVYDWRLYDTIYTERYMSTPQLNPEGYAATSVIEAAADLSGHLLLTHGVMDDNVHMQNALQLIYALQKANVDFELMLYPQARHGIRNGEQRWFDRRLVWRAIQEHLLAPRATTEES